MIKPLSKREVIHWFVTEQPKWRRRKASDMLSFKRRGDRANVTAALNAIIADTPRARIARLSEECSKLLQRIMAASRIVIDPALKQAYREKIAQMKTIRCLEGYRALPGSRYDVTFPYDPVSRHFSSDHLETVLSLGTVFETVECRVPDRSEISSIIEEVTTITDGWWTHIDHPYSDRVTFMFSDSGGPIMFKMLYAGYLYLPD